MFPHRLLISNAPSSHCLPLFDPTFSPAFSRLLVAAVFQLPVLCYLLFLASLLSQPSNAWSTAPIPCFKHHEFLSGFLLQSSIAPAQWFIPSTPRFEKRVSLIPSFQFQMWCYRKSWQDRKSGVCTRWRIFQVASQIN